MIKKQNITYIKEPMREKPVELVVIGERDRGPPVLEPDCSGSIGERVMVVLDAAVEQVSKGSMTFSVRNLFYAVRELHDKLFPGCDFYKKYDSFAQDFLRAYNKKYTRISGLTRMARGKYASPQEDGRTYEWDIKPGMKFIPGCSNKLLIVEKAGLYEAMKENRFDIRLDVVLAYTQGFTTEAGRNMLIEAQEQGYDVCVLHDYDVAGLLIYDSLTKPTKRLDTYLEAEGLYDVGLNWEVITEIRKSRSMTPESVRLNKSHVTALGGMLDRGVISGEEYDLLRDGRIELNQLTPLELLEWLEKRLDDLGLWKTIPEQCDLDDSLNGHIDDRLKADVGSRASDLDWAILKAFGVEDVYSRLLELSEALRGKSKKEVVKLIDDLAFPDMTVKKLEEMLREDPVRYWTVAMKDEAEGMVNDLNEELDGSLDEPGDELLERIKEEEGVEEALAAVEEALREWESKD